VSHAVARVLARDSLAPLWLFARPGASLDSLGRWVVEHGGTVRRRSRWLHALSAELPRTAVAMATQLPTLSHVQPVARFRRAVPDTVTPAFPEAAAGMPALTSAGGLDTLYGNSSMPLRVLRLFPLVQAGLGGLGVRIAILDTGFETELSPFAGTFVAGQYDFVFNDSIVRNEAADVAGASSHGTSVWSLLAARVPGVLIGIAPDAEYLLAKTEDVRSETPLEEDNYVAALEWADSLGAKIVSSSIGYLTFDDGSGYTTSDLNGDVAVTTRAADSAVARGIAVFTAMGNEGPGATTLITPADGDSVLGIGAEDSTGVVATFSSRGPTADGRIKPDFVAPGVSIWMAIPAGSNSVTYGRGNGTSFSTPILAGAGALFLQAHPGYDPVALRDAWRRAADQEAAPDNARGWGRPDVLLATTFPRGLQVAEPGDTLHAVNPRFLWTVPDAPTLARPFAYRLRVTRTGGTIVLLDTLLSDTTVTLPTVLHGGVQIQWSLTATSVDSATARASSAGPLTVPAWVALTSLDDPAGTTIRELRPTFTWASPEVSGALGGFLYALEVERADNGQVDLEARGLSTTSYTPTVDLERNTPYRWTVTARLGSASESVQSRGTFVIVDNSAPAVTSLFQNFPNPFPRPSAGQLTTCLWFDLAVGGFIELTILDLRGFQVRRLMPAGELSGYLGPGRYGRPLAGGGGCDPRFTWDGTTDGGDTVAPGVYLARLRTPDGTYFKRIVFLGPNP
jgi:hypothetical protein